MRDLAKHWEKIYREKGSEEVSWYAPHLERSLELILRTGIDKNASIVDVGGGASTLINDLLEKGFERITVVDLSPHALSISKARVGGKAEKVAWIQGDVTRLNLPHAAYDVWHDRAVFHFLIRPEDRHAYIKSLIHSLKPGGHVILATFGPKGPTRCSGLEVRRYSPQILGAELGEGFTLIETLMEAHRTPSGTYQEFLYAYFKRS